MNSNLQRYSGIRANAWPVASYLMFSRTFCSKIKFYEEWKIDFMGNEESIVVLSGIPIGRIPCNDYRKSFLKSYPPSWLCFCNMNCSREIPFILLVTSFFFIFKHLNRKCFRTFCVEVLLYFHLVA